MIERHPFGRTGHESSRVLFGAAALSRVDQDQADRLLPILDAHGVNHLDVAASYGDAELRLAPWLASRRGDFFLATKTSERTGEGARAELERSLERLGVDSVDLIQLHNLVEEDEWAVAHGPNGAVEALVQARDEGLCKAIGVTGHGLRIPAMHRRSLERFDFDSVLLPFNFLLLEIEEYRRDVEALLSVCDERQVAVQTIKSVARRRWVGERPSDAKSWYEPIREDSALRRAVNFVLSRPGLFLNSSSDFTLLEEILDAAEGPFEPPDPTDLRADAEGLDMAVLFDGAGLERI